jgi:hypothetical protein
MSLINLFKGNTKAKTSRKFLSSSGISCVVWAVEKDGEARLTITDEHKKVVFVDWFGDVKDTVEFDKKLAVLEAEISAFRKAIKTIKK